MSHPENPVIGFREAMIALSQSEPFEVWLTPPRAFVLMAHLQFALRMRASIGNHGDDYPIAEEMYQNLKLKIAEVCPAIAPYLDQGEDPTYDVTAEEFVSAWKDAYPDQ